MKYTPKGYIISLEREDAKRKDGGGLKEEGLLEKEMLKEHSEEHSEEHCEEHNEDGECCCRKTKERSEKEYKDLIHRLNRIEGQIRGIKGMVEKDVYCTDILVQVAAVSAALNSFNKVLLANHIKTCVTRDILEGKEDTVDELVETLKKLMR